MFEVVVGAILTQNTSWTNVEKCINNLKKENALSVGALRKLQNRDLGRLIRSSGYYNQKSIKLKSFISFVDSLYKGDIAEMSKENVVSLRERLLSIKGIGPETADSILLYAFHKPVFVVDAYTRRIMGRLGVIKGDEPYEEIRRLFEQEITSKLKKYPEKEYGKYGRKGRVGIFNQYHALIVNLGKDYCSSRNPFCNKCPLKGLGLCRTLLQ